MLIKKINNNNIELIINSIDIEKKNISVFDFMCLVKTRNVFLLDLLKSIIKNDKINNKNVKSDFYFIHSHSLFVIIVTLPSYKINKNKYKNLKLNNFFLASFSNFDALCDFCNTLNANFFASLFYYKNFYYLNIKLTHLDNFKKILIHLKEFSDKYSVNKFINENAKLIIKNNAIDFCNRFK